MYLLIIDEVGFVPLSRTGAELLFEVFSQRYERDSIMVTINLPFDEWTEVFGSERLTGALLDRLTHHVHILEMNGDSYRLWHSGRPTATPARKPTFLQKERWKAIQKARRKGMSLRAIERELGIHRATVKKYMDAEGPPTRQTRAVVAATPSSDTIQA